MDPERALEIVEGLAFDLDYKPDTMEASRALAVFLLQVAQRCLTDADLEMQKLREA